MIEIGSNIRPRQALAVVVGAGGMGMAVARRLGNTYRLLVADRDGAHLERQTFSLRSEGYDASGAVCDVTDADAVAGLATAAAEGGGPQVLAHVVGVSPSLGDAVTILKVNLLGPTLVAEAFLPILKPGGAAVFVASVAGHGATLTAEMTAALAAPKAPGFVESVTRALGGALDEGQAYRLSKAALIEMCRRSAPTWGRRGVRIVSVSPGMIATPQGAVEFANPAKRGLFERTPLEREGTMIEIADAVEFLASERASFIHGTDLLVDGGLDAATSYPADVAALAER